MPPISAGDHDPDRAHHAPPQGRSIRSFCVNRKEKRIYCVICGGSSSNVLIKEHGLDPDDVAWMDEWQVLSKATWEDLPETSPPGRLLQTRNLNPRAYRTIRVGHQDHVINNFYVPSPDAPLKRPVHAECYSIVCNYFRLDGTAVVSTTVDHHDACFDLTESQAPKDPFSPVRRLACCDARWSDAWSRQEAARSHYSANPHYMPLATAWAKIQDAQYPAKDRLPSRTGIALNRRDLMARLPSEILQRIAQIIMSESMARWLIRFKGDGPRRATAPQGSTGNEPGFHSRGNAGPAAREDDAHPAVDLWEPDAFTPPSRSMADLISMTDPLDHFHTDRPHNAEPHGPPRGVAPSSPALTAETDGASPIEAEKTMLALMSTCKRLYFFDYPSSVWKYLYISRADLTAWSAWPQAPIRWFFEGYLDHELAYQPYSCSGLTLRVKADTDPSSDASAAAPPTPGRFSSNADGHVPSYSSTSQTDRFSPAIERAIAQEMDLERIPPQLLYRGVSKLHAVQNRERLCLAARARDRCIRNLAISAFLSHQPAGDAFLAESTETGGGRTARSDRWRQRTGFVPQTGQRPDQQPRRQRRGEGLDGNGTGQGFDDEEMLDDLAANMDIDGCRPQ